MDGIKPSLYVTSQDLPEIKKWKVGDSYDLIVSVKMTHQSQHEGSPMTATFEVQKVISAENDPMDLEDINNISGNEQFMQAAGNYRKNNGM